jgi:hypothetical protein
LRARPFFLLLSPARNWLPAQSGSLRDHLQSQILFFGGRRLEENRIDRLTAFPDRSSDQGY